MPYKISEVWVQSTVIGLFITQIGLESGDELALVLFSLAFQHVVDNLPIGIRSKIPFKSDQMRA